MASILPLPLRPGPKKIKSAINWCFKVLNPSFFLNLFPKVREGGVYTNLKLRKEGRMRHTYADRNRTIRMLGFATYADYLKSAMWRRIAAEAYSTHGRNCLLCRNASETLHHISYGMLVLMGLNLKPIVPLCNSCHYRVEFFRNGKKRKLVQAQTAFNKLFKNTKQKEERRISRHCKICGNRLRKRGGRCLFCKQKMSGDPRQKNWEHGNQRRKCLEIL